MYEMVTGKVPFDGDTTVAIAIKHLQEEMVPPSVYTEELPHSLEQIILKCTQKGVDRRYQNMEDVIADLKHSLIDPQGDFVTLTSVDNEAKTVVISDKELGEIKHMPKQSRNQNRKLWKKKSMRLIMMMNRKRSLAERNQERLRRRKKAAVMD